MNKHDTYIVGYMVNDTRVNKLICELSNNGLIIPQTNIHITLLYLGKDVTLHLNNEFYDNIKCIRQIKINNMKLNFIGKNVVLELIISKEQNESIKKCIDTYEKNPPIPFLHITLGKIKGRYKDRINKYLSCKYPDGLNMTDESITTDIDIIRVDHHIEKYIQTKAIQFFANEQ